MESKYAFSPLDEIMPNLIITMILCFPCQDCNKHMVYQNLSDGLSNLHKKLPFLSGDVVRQTNDAAENGKRPGSMTLFTADPPASIDIEFNDMTSPDHEWKYSYEELRALGMPMSKLDPALLVPGGTDDPSSSSKFFMTRISFIPGGCFVCASTNHAYVDAWGFVVLLNAWASECSALRKRSEAFSSAPILHPGTLPPALSRHIPSSMYDILKHQPESWQLLGLDWRKLDEDGELAVPFSTKPRFITSIFSFSSSALDGIAEKGMPEDDDFGDRDPIWVSPNDALIAFLWCNILRARAPSLINKPHKADSMAMVAVNGRRALYPAIPMSYIGNVVFCCLTHLPIEQIIAPKTRLSTIALALRQSIEASLDPEVLRSAVDLATCIPDVRRLGNAFKSWFAEDLVTTSLVDFPVYDVSWGELLGKPEFLRSPRAQLAGICSVLPRRPDGSVEVFISLEEEQMSRLRSDKEWCRFVKFVSS